MNGAALVALATETMPFGRHAGTPIIDLPERYLLWFQQKGFPQGKLGGLLALALEIKVNGLQGLVEQALGRRATPRGES
jgi:uncharacterized protein (DUF3820 family)